MKRKRVSRVFNGVRKEAQRRLLEKHIELVAAQPNESWWHKNIVPVLALVVSVFSLMGLGGSRPKVKLLTPPAIVVVVNTSAPSTQPDNAKDKDVFSTKPFDPSVYNPAHNPEFPKFWKSPILIPEPAKETDRHTRSLYNQIVNAIEKSEEPAVTKARIIQRLETKASQHKRLVDDLFVKNLVSEVQKVQILQPTISPSNVEQKQ